MAQRAIGSACRARSAGSSSAVSSAIWPPRPRWSGRRSGRGSGRRACARRTWGSRRWTSRGGATLAGTARYVRFAGASTARCFSGEARPRLVRAAFRATLGRIVAMYAGKLNSGKNARQAARAGHRAPAPAASRSIGYVPAKARHGRGCKRRWARPAHFRSCSPAPNWPVSTPPPTVCVPVGDRRGRQRRAGGAGLRSAGAGGARQRVGVEHGGLSRGTRPARRRAGTLGCGDRRTRGEPASALRARADGTNLYRAVVPSWPEVVEQDLLPVWQAAARHGSRSGDEGARDDRTRKRRYCRPRPGPGAASG